jgi:hypothetical protein
MSERLPCKDINVESSICKRNNRICINCNGYEPIEQIESFDDGFNKVALPELPDNSNYRNNKGKR